jgi:phosphoglucomutase
MDGSPVQTVKNFAEGSFSDVEGDYIPAENMLMLSLADGRRIAVRPSGTEPKIKFYLFAQVNPQAGCRFSAEELLHLKTRVREGLERLWTWIQQDVRDRLAS